MYEEMKDKGISIIVPFLNEEEGIGEFCKKIDEYSLSLSFPLEIVFVDDGSSDDTIKKIEGIEWKNIRKVRIVSLSKNYGSHAAVRAGLQYAYYDICTWMGSDGQDPMEMLEIGYKKIKEENYDAVYIDKKSVAVSKANRLFSKIYSYLMQKYAVKSYSSGGTADIIFNRKIKDLLNQNVEGNSSIMLQIMDMGFKYFTVSLAFNERGSGTSKWTLSKKIKLFIDSFVAFSFMPIRFVSMIGIVMFFVGISTGVYSIINKLFNPEAPLGYTTLVCIIAVGFGITNISLGIIAEYLWRTYDAARRRPVFIVSEVFEVK